MVVGGSEGAAGKNAWRGDLWLQKRERREAGRKDMERGPAVADAVEPCVAWEHASTASDTPKHTRGVWTRTLSHRYHVAGTKVLGSGAHGVVYEASDKWKGGRTVAVKRVRSVFSELGDARNVVREVWLLARMSHDNVIALVDLLATSEGDAFVYFPFVVARLCEVSERKSSGGSVARQIQQLHQGGHQDAGRQCPVPSEASPQQVRWASDPVLDGILTEAPLPGSDWYKAQGSRASASLSSPASKEERTRSGASGQPRVANLYLITELMDTDLRSVIRSDVKLSLQHVRFIMVQLLSAMEYLEARCVVHFDIKPANVLINENWDVKVADFGNARVLHYNSQTFRPVTVVSRFYQPPEALFHERCGLTVDMWAVGCVFAELLSRRVLFDGQSTQEQIVKIVQRLGSPSDEEISWIRDPSNRRMLLSMPEYIPRGFDDLLEALENEKDGLNLLQQMLRFDPRRRISASQALAHPFFTKHVGSSPGLESETASMDMVGDLDMNEMFNEDCDSCLDSEPFSPVPRCASIEKKHARLLVTCMGEDERHLEDAGVDTLRNILDRELRAFSHVPLGRPNSLLDSRIPDVLIGSLTSNFDITEES
ncbi:Mitogen-activated protein kinase 4 [Porphyridium purpureum]|uniref:Mitogen-activated protein kinase 4 n=1 Tax=Porphyridium purpureum TaxID=35688 RepID=A0A5J4YZL1_PORPP|nr:Mitogen-activated protein kinase 4 [Porphyridium purpureum]|eukprot:POR1028..scf209_3